jgi:hypothetical protein
MTTEHEQPASADDDPDARYEEGLRKEIGDPRPDNPAWRPNQYHASDMAFLLRRLDATRLALAERDAEIALLKAQLPDGMKHCTILFKECEKGHGRLTATNWIDHGCQQCEIDRLKTANRHEREQVGKMHSQIARISAEKDIKIRNLSVEIDRLKAPPGYLSGKLNPFPERTPDASALAIAERFRLYFRRPYPTSEEGVERAVQSLAQEIEAAIGRDVTPPGASALEATRDLFQSLEGWRPTDDWTGVPPRLRLLFDRTLHAIKSAEARGRAQKKNPG